ncbi:MAG TPA: hypothetical protein PLP17_00835 [Oligoflexia bacterium]|nr:hypothetical protein [Oligoflexia bacterium]
MKNQRGYLILGVIFMSFIALVVSAGILQISATNTKTRALVKTQAEYYYEAEETLNKTVAWLQANSKNLVTAFVGANFNNNFDVDSSPSLGANEGEFFQVPTMVKINGSSNAAMLSNNEFFGEANFPATQNIDTGASFDAVSAFRSADLGSANSRAILVWARATDGNFEPVFRVDAVTGNNPDRGAHTFTYVYSKLEAVPGAGGGDGIGFFTQNQPLTTKTGNNRCDSYQWTYAGGQWTKGAPRANCIVASNSTIFLEGRISGNALSKVNNGVTVDRPKGEVSGSVCGGASCHNHSIAPLPSWQTTCGDSGSSQGSLTITGTPPALASGAALSQQCWENVVVAPNSTLVLTDTGYPYRFKKLTFQNNGNAVLATPILPPGHKIEIYVDNFDGGSINGQQMFNLNNAPHTLVVNITSNQSFTLNGTADMNMRLFAPASYVEMLGTFNFHGAIEASRFAVTGNGTFNYDEGCSAPSAPVVTDMAFSLKKASQRYR